MLWSSFLLCFAAAIGVLGDVATATLCVLKGSVIDRIEIVYKKCNLSSKYSPSEFNACLNITRKNSNIIFNQAGVSHTARLLSKSELFVPGNIRNPKLCNTF